MRHISIMDRNRLPQLAIAALLAATTAVALGANSLVNPSVVRAEKVWDLEAYESCKDEVAGNQMDESINTQKSIEYFCCTQSGGIFQDDGYLGKCVAPPPEPAPPGARHVPPDIGTETLTPQPLRPIHDPSDIGTEAITPVTSPPPPVPPTTTMAPPPG